VRVFLAIVIVVAVLAFVADIVVTNVAEDRAAERLSETLSAPSEVEMGGWPVSVRLLGGRLPQVDITATDVPLRDTSARLQRLDATLTDVEFGWTWSSGLEGRVIAHGGSFTAELGEAAVQSLVDPTITVTLEEGVVRATLAGAQLDATAEVDGDTIVLRPAADLFAGLGELRLPLEGLPEGVQVESVRIEPGVLLLAGGVDDFVVGPAAVEGG
jgi:hypothetical protein